MRHHSSLKLIAWVTLTLLSATLTACWPIKPEPVIVMPEARAVLLDMGQPAPFKGWLISESAMAKLVTAAESCKAGK